MEFRIHRRPLATGSGAPAVRRRPHRHVCCSTLLVALLASGCGSDGQTAAAPPSGGLTAVDVSLDDVMVTADDLGAPWTREDIDIDALLAEAATSTTAFEDESWDDCLDEADAGHSGEPGTLEAAAMFEMTPYGPWMMINAGRSSSVLDLQAKLDQVLACDGTMSWQGGTYTVTPHPFPELGDGSIAYRVVLSGSGTWNDGTRVIAIVQVGDVVLDVGYSDLSPDELLNVDAVESVMRLMVERLSPT